MWHDIQFDSSIENKVNQICVSNNMNVSDVFKIFMTKTAMTGVLSEKVIKSIDRIKTQDKVTRNELIEKCLQIILDNDKTLDSEKLKAKVLSDLEIIEQSKDIHIAAGEYFEMGLYDKSVEQIKEEYLSDNDTKWIYDHFNKPDKNVDTSNKYTCYKLLQQYYHRQVYELPDDIKAAKKMCEDKLADLGFYILKAKHGSLGDGVKIIRSKSDIDSYFSDYPYLGSIIEEYVKQSDDIGILNSSSLNTIRFTIINTGTKKYIHSYFRIGRAGLEVDNVAKGGIICELDQDTGKIIRCVDKFGHRFDRHPDSGLPLVGFFIPDYNKAKQLACDISDKMQSTHKYIGVDLAKTDDGWVLIEFNNKTGIVSVQTAFNRGLKKDIKAIISKM